MIVLLSFVPEMKTIGVLGTVLGKRHDGVVTIMGFPYCLSQQVVEEASATAHVSAGKLSQYSSSTAAKDAEDERLVDVEMGACLRQRIDWLLSR